MSRAWPLVVLVLLLPASVLSDSSNLEGGVFIAHHPPGLQYSSGQDWCARYFQEFAIDSCSDQNPRIDVQGDNSVWFVLAAWSEEKEFCGAEFGFAAYDSSIYLMGEWGACYPDSGGMEIPTAGWPGPNKGTAITAKSIPWSGNIVPIYYFIGYAYYTGVIPLAASPATGLGGTANCETPPQTWQASSFGSMGILEDGVAACPEGTEGGGGLDGGVQPDGADGYGGYENDGGQGGDADTVACCFNAECRVLTADECERLGGFVRADWRNCDLTPCRNYPDGGLDTPIPLDELYPPISRIVCARVGSPAVFYLDPGDDGSLSFQLCTMHPNSSPTTLTISLYDPRDTEGDPVYSEENVIVDDPPGHYVTGWQWPRTSGMAKLVVTTIQGDGHYYAFCPLSMADPANTDHEYFNGNIIARPGDNLPEGWTAHYKLWVPTMADSITLRCFAEWGGTWGCTGCILQNPEGERVYERYYSEQPDTYRAAVPETWRGAPWDLTIYTWDLLCIGPASHGLLEAAFRSATDAGWWTPDFAFSTMPESPVRAQFSPWSVFATSNPQLPKEGAQVYYAPYGSSADSYAERGVLDPTARLAWSGRQRFTIAAYPGEDRRAAVHHLIGDPVPFEWHTADDPTKHYDTASATTPEVDLTVPAGGILLITVLKTSAGGFDITTDAPLASCGPVAGFHWGRIDPLGEPAASEDITFFVPTDVDTLKMTMEAKRWCADNWEENECVEEPGVMYNRAYPITRLVLTDPGGARHDFAVGPATHGRLELALPLIDELAGYRGHAWMARVETDDEHTGIGVDLAFGDEIPPYATWLDEKERLVVPLCFPATSQMVHSVTPYWFRWRVVPSSDLYFASAEGCSRSAQGVWTIPDPAWPAGQDVRRRVEPAGQAHKEELSTRHTYWVPPTQMAMVPMTTPILAYAVPRPLGLTTDGSLRTTLNDVPQEARQFVGLAAVTKGAPDPPDPDGLQSLAATEAAGFKHSSVAWVGGPGWADIAHQYYEQIANIGLPGVGPVSQNWTLLESSAEQIASKGHILTTGYTDEPFAVGGYDTDALYEATYRLRLHDTRHPIKINEEPELLPTRELRDALDVWDEDQYSKRWRREGVDEQEFYPSCEVVTRLREITSRVRAGTGAAIHVLGGFPELGDHTPDNYVSTSRDSLGGEVLSALLIGAGDISVFCKVFDDRPDHDLEQREPALWGALPTLTEPWNAVERWIHDNVVYDMGVRGAPVQECEWPPVTFGVGYWDEQLQSGVIGTWYAFCNVAREQAWADTVSWAELHLAPEQSPQCLPPDGASVSPPEYGLVANGLRVALGPGEWIVGRVAVHVDPTTVGDRSLEQTCLSLVPAPNPSGDLTTLRLSVSSDGVAGVTVYDVQGRRIWQSVRTVRAGSNTVVWDGRGSDGALCPSGLYRVVARAERMGTERTCWVVRIR